MKRPVVQPSDMPAKCRVWDNARWGWVAKARWPTAAEARAANTDRGQSEYRCGDHWHLGHRYGRKR